MAVKKRLKRKNKMTSDNLGKNKLSFFVKNKDLIKRIFFTLMVLVLIKAGSLLTTPGITYNKDFEKKVQDSQFFGLLSMLGGGTLGQFSILALGVSPYITASIIVQLLSTDVVPVLSRWAKSGEKGRKKLDSLTKGLTIPFAIMQGIATIFTLQKNGVITPKWESANDFGKGTVGFYYALVGFILLAGTFLMLWLADQITMKGIGNGVSLIIFAGIVSKLPDSFKQTYTHWVGGQGDTNLLFDGILQYSIYLAIFFLVVLFVVVLNESERRIPIQQTGSGLAGTNDVNKPYLPLKINSAGVIPVIFASALISAPVTIAQIIELDNPLNGFVLFTHNYLQFTTWPGITIYAVLVVLFTFLYSQVQMNPEKMAENFQKSGTFIPGIRPGKETERYLKGIINRLSCIGSIFLSFIAILPYIIAKVTELPSQLALGGTSLIIMVSVSLETIRQIKGRITQQSFINKKSQSLADDNKSTYLW